MVDKLRYFLKIAQLSSFRKAADELYVSQPALSSSVMRLEKELGVKLFNRDRQNVELTDMGREIIPEAMSICSHYDKILSIISNSRDKQNCALRIGTTMQHVIIIVEQFLRENTNCNVVLKQYSSYPLMKKALIDGAVDICFCAPPVRDVVVQSEILVNEPLCVLMNCANPLAKRNILTLEDLGNETVIKLPGAHPFNAFVTNMYKSAGIEEPVCIMHVDAEMGALYIASTTGSANIIIMPVFRCRELTKDSSKLCYVPLSANFARSIGVSYPKKTPLSKIAVAFIDSARKYYSSNSFAL